MSILIKKTFFLFKQTTYLSTLLLPAIFISDDSMGFANKAVQAKKKQARPRLEVFCTKMTLFSVLILPTTILKNFSKTAQTF
jgi:hypothetical protein